MLQRNLRRRLRQALPALALATLAACGGGGGGGSSLPEPGGGGGAPPAPPPISKADAFRFLNQASFGATEADISRLTSLGDSQTAYARWIDQQLAQPASLQLPTVQMAFASLANPAQMLFTLNQDRQEIWFRNALQSPDQLRQRVAFALSQILVVSQQSALQNLPFALADYYDLLALGAFGDFRQLLQDVTLHPAMGVYLNMLGNQKPDEARNIRPDENYARELLQLFTIGLVELNPDGTARNGPDGVPLPAFDQAVIEGLANVFTGWHFAGAPDFSQARPTRFNQVQPMQAYPEQHSPLTKQLLQYPGVAKPLLPAGQTALQDLNDALDNIFNHPNVGPFIARQLIQRLVTSNPSPQYVARVAARFDDDGGGRRGQLVAVVRAVLLDAEARPAATTVVSGKVKEPLLRLTQLWRAYGAQAANGQYRLGNISASFGQGPLQAPSVFNFFSPSYAPPGEIADQGWVAPELQIATEYLNTTVTNAFYGAIFGWNSTVAGLPSNAVVIDISEETALAGSAGALVDRLADKLLGGVISPALRSEAVTAVGRVPAANGGQRVAEAMYLIATSPEYVVQR